MTNDTGEYPLSSFRFDLQIILLGKGFYVSNIELTEQLQSSEKNGRKGMKINLVQSYNVKELVMLVINYLYK